MKIWHVGDLWSARRVDGVSNSAWLLSREQARRGHDVSLIIHAPPDSTALETAADAGMTLVQTSRSIFRLGAEVRRILERQTPDVVHMHSVFIPQHAVMARVLRQRGIPYVIKPAGGLLPQVLRRNVIKKRLYGNLVERPRFMGAAAIANVTPGEERAIRAYLPDFRKPIRWIPDSVDVDALGPHCWQGVPSHAAQKRIAFLGRFDVLCKGIDILIEIARLLPEARFDLYGTEDTKTRDWLARLKQNQPANVAFHEPIFGPDKGKMLAGASLYIQPSRWEGFGISVAEAMYLGVPCAIAASMNMAGIFRPLELGLVLSANPREAADQIHQSLSRPEQLHRWSQRGRDFARTHFHPGVAAERYLELYLQAAQVRAQAGRTNCGGAKPALPGAALWAAWDVLNAAATVAPSVVV
jgi:glycosyltransferase involved in cell wall biosynthesis